MSRKEKPPILLALVLSRGCTGVHVAWSNDSAQLHPERLNLSPADMALATVIAEETERERERRRAAGGSAYVNSPFPAGGLLGGDYFASLPWHELLQSLDVVMTCASRSGLTMAGVVRFAYEKCQPAETWGLFWMAAYLDAVAVSVTDLGESARAMAKAAQLLAVSAAAERRRQAGRGAEARAAKFRDVEAATREKWKVEASEWRGKTEFAQVVSRQIANEHGLTVSARTIAEKWLAPSRVAGK